MLKKLLLASATVLMATPVFAAGLPLFPNGAWDPSNALGSLNSWINNLVNPNASGSLAAFVSPVTSSGTSIDVAYTYIMPGNTLTKAGQSVHIHAWGANDSTATDVRTVTFTWGASGTTCALNTTGASNSWVADFNATLTSTVAQGSTAAQSISCNSVASNGTSTPVTYAAVSTAPTLDNTANIQVTLSLTAATAGTMTVDGMLVTAARN